MNTTANVRNTGRQLLKKALLPLLLVALCLPGAAFAADQNPLAGLKVSLEGFAEYSAGQTGKDTAAQTSFNKFSLTRGYVTLKKSVNPYLAARVTTDVHQLSSGDWEVRLKYLYGEVKAGDLGFITGVKSEIGLGHTPWIDFEEHINPYRAQGPMATDRGGLQTSSDIGVSLAGDFGGKLEDGKAKTGNSHYTGRFGSFHIGVYNGAGYHGTEANQNKVVEARITVRPLADALPGLKLSYLGTYGKGNTAASPDYNLNLGMVSFQHPDFIVTAQYFNSKGNFKGSLVDGNGDSLTTVGYSFFGVYHLPMIQKRLSVFGRYDHANNDDKHKLAKDADYAMYVGGVSYDLGHGNMVLADYENISYGDNSGGMGKNPVVANKLGDDSRIQVVYKFEF